jgi:uncharacterized protein (TIGR02996 family)
MALSDALKRAASAGDAATTISSLLEAWRELPAPPLADLLDELTAKAAPTPPPDFDEAAGAQDVVEVGRLLDAMRGIKASDALGRITTLGWIQRDPRASAALVRLVAEPPFTSAPTKTFWIKVFEMLDANADPRALAALQKVDYPMVDRFDGVHRTAMGEWMYQRVQKTIAKLQKAFPKPPALPADAKAALAKIKLPATSPSSKPAKPAAKKGGSIPELYAAVYANPDDDAPRAVLADALTQAGDPRGEFISLQLAQPRSPDDLQRLLTMLRKNQKPWLGALAPYVRELDAPSVKPLDSEGRTVWWNRGFLTGCTITLNKRALAEHGTSPVWSTVERIERLWTDGSDADLAKHLGALRSLKRVNNAPAEIFELAAKQDLLGKLEHAHCEADTDAVPGLLEHAAKLPKLRSLGVNATSGAPASVVAAAKPWERFETFRFTTPNDVYVIMTRTSAGLALRFVWAYKGVEKYLAEWKLPKVVSIEISPESPSAKALQKLYKGAKVIDPSVDEE